jgi:hypothetical protein
VLDSDLVIDGPGANTALGHVVLDLSAGLKNSASRRILRVRPVRASSTSARRFSPTTRSWLHMFVADSPEEFRRAARRESIRVTNRLPATTAQGPSSPRSAE